jgi:hypothetical protein
MQNLLYGYLIDQLLRYFVEEKIAIITPVLKSNLAKVVRSHLIRIGSTTLYDLLGPYLWEIIGWIWNHESVFCALVGCGRYQESVRWILRCYQILGASILDAEDRSKIPGARVWDFYSPVLETGVYSRSVYPPSKMWVMHGL